MVLPNFFCDKPPISYLKNRRGGYELMIIPLIRLDFYTKETIMNSSPWSWANAFLASVKSSCFRLLPFSSESFSFLKAPQFHQYSMKLQTQNQHWNYHYSSFRWKTLIKKYIPWIILLESLTNSFKTLATHSSLSMLIVLEIVERWIDTNVAFLLIENLLLISSGRHDCRDVFRGIVICPLTIENAIKQLPLVDLSVLKYHPAVTFQRTVSKVPHVELLLSKNTSQSVRIPFFIAVSNVVETLSQWHVLNFFKHQSTFFIVYELIIELHKVSGLTELYKVRQLIYTSFL